MNHWQHVSAAIGILNRATCAAAPGDGTGPLLEAMHAAMLELRRVDVLSRVQEIHDPCRCTNPCDLPECECCSEPGADDLAADQSVEVLGSGTVVRSSDLFEALAAAGLDDEPGVAA